MKYILVERHIKGEAVQRLPIMFPKELVHSDVLKGLNKTAPEGEQYVIVSAGEVALQALKVGGGSSTLGVQSQPGDLSEINMIDITHGMI